MIARLWRVRWNVVRLVVAAFLLWAVAVDSGPRLARLALAALPEFDHAAEVARLRGEGRFGEAVVIADAGLAAAAEVGDPAKAAAIEREKQATLDEQGSWLRRAKDAGWGALTGRGESVEELIGAVAADFFVVGDVRDLVIQGVKYAFDGEADPVIVALSAVGIATTVTPWADVGAAVAKVARKTGALSVRLGERVVELARAGRREGVVALAGDVGRLAERASPGGALRLLRHADDAEDLARMARFAERPGGAAALQVTGREGAAWLRRGEGAEEVVLKAARKGEAGRGFLRSPAAARLMTPHPLVGLAKGLWKGNVEALAARAAAWLDPRAWWVLPGLAAWVFVEGWGVVRRMKRVDGFTGERRATSDERRDER